ncbi:hypothetical protein NUW58_g1098 [Xylaria curta]|uniref:Uncharacterized protein n=1 Tax=Xylaria curta TaxID=42375 RepID=A0ACC1PNC5_9PEZI|nr:hypothetical protein NUW58_g1098 [Xylaria curta]
MTSKPNVVASLVQQEFEKLPAKRKPVIRDNGLHEWVPLSGIVAEGIIYFSPLLYSHSILDKYGKFTCLSLATGMKCLPSSKLAQAQGNVLHDWHAEILAIRAFNCFVLDECRRLASGSESSSDFIRWRSSAEMSDTIDLSDSRHDEINWHGQPFAWREDVLLHMYCSEAPYRVLTPAAGGDASMELTMASQADATPWAVPGIPLQGKYSSPDSIVPTPAPLEPNTVLPGRAYFSRLGIVRRKPSRGDAPPTLSKSCSDKLSLHQCTSLLSSLTSLLVSPDHAYISTLILPVSQYSASGCRRAFSDGHGTVEGKNEEARMASLAAQNRSQNRNSGYAFHPFDVRTTGLEFVFSRRSAALRLSSSPSSLSSPMELDVGSGPNIKIIPCNLSLAVTASSREETTLNGVLQGHKASEAHVRGASFTSRRRMWSLAAEVVGLIGNDVSNIRHIGRALGVTSPNSSSTSISEIPLTTKRTYGDVKNSPTLAPRRRAKDAARQLALKGWVRNLGDEDFML